MAAQKGAFWPEVFAYGLYETAQDGPLADRARVAGRRRRAHRALRRGQPRSRSSRRRGRSRTACRLLDQKLRRDLGTLVEKQYREAEKAREQYEALEATRALADENLRARTRAFEEGVGTSLEVVDARLAQEKVRLERLAAAYGFVNALAELLEASGQGDRFEELPDARGRDRGAAMSTTRTTIAAACSPARPCFSCAGCHRPDLVQGEVEAAQVDVSAKIPGRVAEVLVDVGQSVKKGDTLARLESPEIGAKLDQATAARAAAGAQSAKADRGARGRRSARRRASGCARRPRPRSGRRRGRGSSG